MLFPICSKLIRNKWAREWLDLSVNYHSNLDQTTDSFIFQEWTETLNLSDFPQNKCQIISSSAEGKHTSLNALED